MKFKVQWNYKSSLGGPFLKGDVVDLNETLADAINRDSPGVLVESKAAVKINRMQADAEFERKSVQRGKGEAITKKDFKAVKG